MSLRAFIAKGSPGPVEHRPADRRNLRRHASRVAWSGNELDLFLSLADLADAVISVRDAFERQGDALAAANAQSDETTRQAVPPHGVEKSHSQDSPRGADRMAMRNGAALDIHDLFIKSKLAH